VGLLGHFEASRPTDGADFGGAPGDGRPVAQGFCVLCFFIGFVLRWCSC
jgi:hypothetical protein